MTDDLVTRADAAMAKLLLSATRVDMDVRCEADDAVKALAAEITRLKTVIAAKWQPIETAPRDGTPVILAGQYVDHPSVAAFNGHEWVGKVDGCSAVRYMSDFGSCYITVDLPEFWMPLPEPPATLTTEADQTEGGR